MAFDLLRLKSYSDAQPLRLKRTGGHGSRTWNQFRLNVKLRVCIKTRRVPSEGS